MLTAITQLTRYTIDFGYIALILAAYAVASLIDLTPWE